MLDDDWIHVDDRHRDVAGFTLANDDRHLIRIERLLQHCGGIFGLALDHVLTSTGFSHGRQRGSETRIGGLITGRPVAAVIDNQQYKIIGNVIGDGWQSTEISQYRAVAIDGDDLLLQIKVYQFL